MASPDQLECLINYVREIELWNPTCKLIAQTDALIARHILDSLAGVPCIRELGPKKYCRCGLRCRFSGHSTGTVAGQD